MEAVPFSGFVIGTASLIFPKTLRSENALISGSIFSRASTLTHSTGAQMVNKGQQDVNTQLFETAFIV